MNTLLALVTSAVLFNTTPQVPVSTPAVLSETNYSLTDRYTNTFVNDVFSDNILLTLAYMNGTVKTGEKVDWNLVRSDFTYTVILKPGETFAFHDRVLPQYVGKIALTTNSRFNSEEGFLSDHYLVGDGVCHLASFMNVVARNAGLTVVSPTAHDFAKIADVPKEYGTAIYYDPNAQGSSALQNLYITNNRGQDVQFVFRHANNALDIRVLTVAATDPLLSLGSPLI